MRHDWKTVGLPAFALAMLIAYLSDIPLAFADEPLFGFLYTTDVLPKGGKEIEQWVTWRTRKAGGSFNLWQFRTEASYGVTNNLQGSIYANWATFEAERNLTDGTTGPPETFAEAQCDPFTRCTGTKYVSTSFEGIYRIFSPYTDGFGLAVLAEPSIGYNLREFEARLILQKNFIDDLLVMAFNLTWAPEARWLPSEPNALTGLASGHWDHELDVNMGLGASYRFAPNWSLGVELINEREFAGFNIFSAPRTNQAWFLGPTLHYAATNWFATLTFLEQLPFGKDYANEPPGNIQNGRTYADDFEKYRLRLKAGYTF